MFGSFILRSIVFCLCLGYSDYDYDIRSVTDDTDDYTEHTGDVVDDLENLKPELKERFQNERRISRSRILDLERELEGQQDHYRANDAANKRQILALEREIEGMVNYWFNSSTELRHTPNSKKKILGPLKSRQNFLNSEPRVS